MNTIPSQKDINPYGDAKAAAAALRFAGKDGTQALHLFQEAGGIAAYLEDLYWMGPAAFDVYFEAVCDFYEQELPASPRKAEMLLDLIKLAQERYNIHARSLLSKSEEIKCLLADARPLLEAELRAVDEGERAEVEARQAVRLKALAAMDDYVSKGPQMRAVIWQKAIYDSYHRRKYCIIMLQVGLIALFIVGFADASLAALPSVLIVVVRILCGIVAAALAYCVCKRLRYRCPQCAGQNLCIDRSCAADGEHVFLNCKSCDCSVRTDMVCTMSRERYTKDQHFDANC